MLISSFALLIKTTMKTVVCVDSMQLVCEHGIIIQFYGKYLTVSFLFLHSRAVSHVYRVMMRCDGLPGGKCDSEMISASLTCLGEG